MVGAAAIAMGQDVNIAHETAKNAVDNNFLGILTYGLAAADAAYAALRIRSAYDDHGVEGVVSQVCTEVVSVATGLVAGRVAGEVAYKIGGAVYPTLDKAFKAYFKSNPEVAKALGGFTDTLIDAGKKITQTVGSNKYVAGATQKLQQVENAIRHVENKAVETVKQQVGSFGENLVEHTVQQSTLTKLFKPLGRGNTGRFEPKDLHEKLVMETIIAHPYLGDELGIKKGMTDKRWHQKDGWVKMYWRDHDNNIEIHYVAQKRNGVIVAVDDFKFKEQSIKQ